MSGPDRLPAGAALAAAAMAALRADGRLNSVGPPAPVQASPPFSTVEAGAETDWSHKTGEGRELRLAVTIRDAGERPERLHLLMAAAEEALAAVPRDLPGWRLVTLRFLRARTISEGPARWAGVSEYRARLLAAPTGA